jgi:hypothetical protein
MFKKIKKSIAVFAALLLVSSSLSANTIDKTYDDCFDGANVMAAILIWSGYSDETVEAGWQFSFSKCIDDVNNQNY